MNTGQRLLLDFEMKGGLHIVSKIKIALFPILFLKWPVGQSYYCF